MFSCERARYAFDGCSRLESSVVAPRCALSQLSGVLGSADWSGSGAAAGAVARDGEHHLAERPRLEDALRAEHAQVARLRVMSELHHARKLRGAVAQCERVEHGARVWLPRGVVPRRLRAGEALVCQDDGGDGEGEVNPLEVDRGEGSASDPVQPTRVASAGGGVGVS